MKNSRFIFRWEKRLVLVLALITGLSARAEVTVPAIFGDHMVLQQQIKLPIWGTAAPGEVVTVTAGKVTGMATAGADGKWVVKLEGLAASNVPIDVTVAGQNKITFHDVLVGDVWVCSGQSNMEFSATKESSAKEDLSLANQPQIRLFFVPKSPQRTPSDSIGPVPAKTPLEGSWQLCTPDTLVKDGDWNGFSAVGYAFGREINGFTHAPVGLIGSYWQGMPAQVFTSLEALQANPVVKPYADEFQKFQDDFDKLEAAYQTDLPLYPARLEKWNADNKAAVDAYSAALAQWRLAIADAVARKLPFPPQPHAPKPPYAPQDPAKNPRIPTVLYNGMIHPIIPYGIKGVIWYQGESNEGKPVEYRTLFPVMIQDWRARWGEGDFPFLFVQLANYMSPQPNPTESNWAALREAQAKTLSLPNTGMAVTIDIGEGTDIHPKDKDDVGHRLALAAQKVAYGQSITSSGPVYQAMTVEGEKIRISFAETGQGLVTGVSPPHFHPGEARTVDPNVEGFTIAGADRKFCWVHAVIDGNTVVVSNPAVEAPIAVRYAWADNPVCNLYNKDQLPAVPFRTDDWPVGEQVIVTPKK